MTHPVLMDPDLSHHASGLPDRDTYLDTTATWLSAGVPGDLTGWVRLAKGAVEVWYSNDKVHRNCSSLASLIDEHPIVMHRRAHPDAELVQRLSDCISERAFRSSRVYRELFQPIGARYQMVIPTAVNETVTAWRCWIINRSAQDFTEADLVTARTLQPVLALLDTIYSSSSTRGASSSQGEGTSTRAHLTTRELDILTLIGDGLSAHQIARLTRISVRTVRKHLEHIYEKLECHDRLLAVNKARQMGLLNSHEPALRV